MDAQTVYVALMGMFLLAVAYYWLTRRQPPR